MTAQIPDKFLYQCEKYNLAGIDGKKLITPQDYGMNPKMLHTACWRGFYSTYEITNDGLFLIEMTIGEVAEGYKPIQDIMPKLPSQDSYSYPTYQGLKLFTSFTGKILLGKDFIKELYVHLGIQAPTSYETLLQVTLEAGKPINIQDISSENAEKREMRKQDLT
jgi:hypothetical protein